MPLLPQGPGGDSPGPGPESPGPGPDELGATDELIAFKDEGEEERRRDLDDVKSSLVNETETRDHRPEPKAEPPLGGPGGPEEAGGPGAEPEDRAYQQARRTRRTRRTRQDAGLLHTPLVGFPLFMVPDLSSICSPPIRTGGLSRRTFLPLQWPLLDLPGPSATGETPATQLSSMPRPEASTPQRVWHGVSPAAGVSRTPQATGHTLSPGGVAHPLSWLLMAGTFSPRLVMSPRPPAPAPAAVRIKQEPGCSHTHRRSPASEEEKKKKPHIKKPLNAFMLYMREERARVVRECSVKESATINQILGQRWHSLSKDDQAKYYELAREERLIHSKLYPGWSARDNYGRKKKRKRSQTDAAPPVQDLPLELRRPRPPPGEALLAALARPPPTRPPSASHLTHTHLSQASPASSLDSPATPTSALASPAAPAPTHTEDLNSSPRACTSPRGDQLQPLSLTTKPLRRLRPLRGPTSSGTPPPPLPPPSPPIPPPTSTHQSAVSCHGALTPPLSLRAANQQ